jgi:hypothetical protein
MSMRVTMRSMVQSWWRSAVLGLALALLFGALMASRNPDDPASVVVVVAALTTWPVVAVALQVLWFDRAATGRDIAQGELGVEHAWFQEAAATAFATMIGGLLFLEGVGSALTVSWMAPVGLAHALVLGLGTFAGSYLWLRFGRR